MENVYKEQKKIKKDATLCIVHIDREKKMTYNQFNLKRNKQLTKALDGDI